MKIYHLYNIRLFIVYYSQQWDLYFVFLLISSLLFHLKEVSLTFLLGPVCAVLCLVIQLCVTLCDPWGFSKQECWSGLPCPPPGDLLNPGTECRSPTLQMDSLLSELPGKPMFLIFSLILFLIWISFCSLTLSIASFILKYVTLGIFCILLPHFSSFLLMAPC